MGLVNSILACGCVFLRCGRVDVFPHTFFEGLWCLLLLGFLQGNVGLLPLLLLLLLLLFSFCCDLKNTNHVYAHKHVPDQKIQRLLLTPDFALSNCYSCVDTFTAQPTFQMQVGSQALGGLSL